MLSSPPLTDLQSLLLLDSSSSRFSSPPAALLSPPPLPAFSWQRVNPQDRGGQTRLLVPFNNYIPAAGVASLTVFLKAQ